MQSLTNAKQQATAGLAKELDVRVSPSAAPSFTIAGAKKYLTFDDCEKLYFAGKKKDIEAAIIGFYQIWLKEKSLVAFSAYIASLLARGTLEDKVLACKQIDIVCKSFEFDNLRLPDTFSKEEDQNFKKNLFVLVELRHIAYCIQLKLGDKEKVQMRYDQLILLNPHFRFMDLDKESAHTVAEINMAYFSSDATRALRWLKRPLATNTLYARFSHIHLPHRINSPDPVVHAAVYKELAKLGEAKYFLATRSHANLLLSQSKPEEMAYMLGVKLLTEAANAGEPSACLLIARMKAAAKDYKEVNSMMTKAAKGHHPEACFEMACLLSHEPAMKGFSFKPEEAFDYLVEAATNHFQSAACYNLGKLIAKVILDDETVLIGIKTGKLIEHKNILEKLKKYSPDQAIKFLLLGKPCAPTDVEELITKIRLRPYSVYQEATLKYLRRDYSQAEKLFLKFMRDSKLNDSAIARSAWIATLIAQKKPLLMVLKFIEAMYVKYQTEYEKCALYCLVYFIKIELQQSAEEEKGKILRLDPDLKFLLEEKHDIQAITEIVCGYSILQYKLILIDYFVPYEIVLKWLAPHRDQSDFVRVLIDTCHQDPRKEQKNINQLANQNNAFALYHKARQGNFSEDTISFMMQSASRGSARAAYVIAQCLRITRMITLRDEKLVLADLKTQETPLTEEQKTVSRQWMKQAADTKWADAEFFYGVWLIADCPDKQLEGFAYVKSAVGDSVGANAAFSRMILAYYAKECSENLRDPSETNTLVADTFRDFFEDIDLQELIANKEVKEILKTYTVEDVVKLLARCPPDSIKNLLQLAGKVRAEKILSDNKKAYEQKTAEQKRKELVSFVGTVDSPEAKKLLNLLQTIPVKQPETLAKPPELLKQSAALVKQPEAKKQPPKANDFPKKPPRIRKGKPPAPLIVPPPTHVPYAMGAIKRETEEDRRRKYIERKASEEAKNAALTKAKHKKTNKQKAKENARKLAAEKAAAAKAKADHLAQEAEKKAAAEKAKTDQLAQEAEKKAAAEKATAAQLAQEAEKKAAAEKATAAQLAQEAEKKAAAEKAKADQLAQEAEKKAAAEKAKADQLARETKMKAAAEKATVQGPAKATEERKKIQLSVNATLVKTLCKDKFQENRNNLLRISVSQNPIQLAIKINELLAELRKEPLTSTIQEQINILEGEMRFLKKRHPQLSFPGSVVSASSSTSANVIEAPPVLMRESSLPSVLHQSSDKSHAEIAPAKNSQQVAACVPASMPVSHPVAGSAPQVLVSTVPFAGPVASLPVPGVASTTQVHGMPPTYLGAAVANVMQAQPYNPMFFTSPPQGMFHQASAQHSAPTQQVFHSQPGPYGAVVYGQPIVVYDSAANQYYQTYMAVPFQTPSAPSFPGRR